MREGYTTGSAVSAAAVAAFRQCADPVELLLPGGKKLVVPVKGESSRCLAILQRERLQRLPVVQRLLVRRKNEGIELVVKTDATNYPRTLVVIFKKVEHLSTFGQRFEGENE